MLHFFKKKEKHLEIALLYTHVPNDLDNIIYSSWYIECDRLKSVILGHFLPFYPPKNLKDQNFEKNEKSCQRYYHFTHLHQKYNHLMYGSWDIEWDRRIFFALLPFATTWKIKILKKCKNHLVMASFYTCVPKITTISCTLFFYQIWYTFYKQWVNNMKMKNNTQKRLQHKHWTLHTI